MGTKFKDLELFTIHGKSGDPYLTRVTVLPRKSQLPEGHALRVHYIWRSDEDPELHDHPSDFRSLILHGSYLETRRDGSQHLYEPGDVNEKKAEEAHRLDVIGPVPVITLVTWGPKRRTWGFYLKDGTWMNRKQFLDQKYGPGNYTVSDT